MQKYVPRHPDPLPFGCGVQPPTTHPYTPTPIYIPTFCQGLLEYAIPECVKVCWSMSGLLGFRVLRSSMTILGLLECMRSRIVQGLLEYVIIIIIMGHIAYRHQQHL